MSYEDEYIKNYFNSFDLKNWKKQEAIIDYAISGEEYDDFYENINFMLDIVKDFNKFSAEIFEKAKEFVIGKKFESIDDYKVWCVNRTEHFNIPIDANKVYKNLGWISWNDYLGIDNSVLIITIGGGSEENYLKTVVNMEYDNTPYWGSRDSLRDKWEKSKNKFLLFSYNNELNVYKIIDILNDSDLAIELWNDENYNLIFKLEYVKVLDINTAELLDILDYKYNYYFREV
jgi:hypothetical protein